MSSGKYEIGKMTSKWGGFIGNVFFDGLTPKARKNTRKKISWDKACELGAQSHNKGCMEVLQILLTMHSVIEKDSAIKQEDKFDMLLGEIEQLTIESSEHFRKKWGGVSYPTLCVDTVKNRVAHWNVTSEIVVPEIKANPDRTRFHELLDNQESTQ